MYACVWLATAVGVGLGLYITKNPNCLWAFLIPAWMGFPGKD